MPDELNCASQHTHLVCVFFNWWHVLRVVVIGVHGHVEMIAPEFSQGLSTVCNSYQWSNLGLGASSQGAAPLQTTCGISAAPCLFDDVVL